MSADTTGAAAVAGVPLPEPDHRVVVGDLLIHTFNTGTLRSYGAACVEADRKGQETTEAAGAVACLIRHWDINKEASTQWEAASLEEGKQAARRPFGGWEVRWLVDARSPSEPSAIDLCRELRTALGLFSGAMPCTPAEAWAGALAEVARLRQQLATSPAEAAS